jgi:hypothetical protein
VVDVERRERFVAAPARARQDDPRLVPAPGAYALTDER